MVLQKEVSYLKLSNNDILTSVGHYKTDKYLAIKYSLIKQSLNTDDRKIAKIYLLNHHQCKNAKFSVSLILFSLKYKI